MSTTSRWVARVIADAAVHRPGHAVPETVGVDENHEVELESLDQLGREGADATAPAAGSHRHPDHRAQTGALDDHRRALGVLGEPVPR